MAAKKTSDIIPMCHPLNLSQVEIDFFPHEKESRIDIEAKVKIKAQTGVEMEGFVAVAAAGLTIYDMCKAIDRGMVISDIHLVKKTGGKSGTYQVRSSEIRVRSHQSISFKCEDVKFGEPIQMTVDRTIGYELCACVLEGVSNERNPERQSSGCEHQ